MRMTRIDLAVALACIALVLGQAGIINAGGRERSKREVCLANLRMLTAAWQMYADDNAGKLVNGGQPSQNLPSPTEPYWCTSFNTPTDPGFDWCLNAGSTGCTTALTYEERIAKLKKGALYKYCRDATVFRCPQADKDMHRSYIIPESMNAQWAFGHTEGTVVKSIGQINKPKERVVFFEEKRLTPDAFMFAYNTNPSTVYWDSDKPQVMHGHGINAGFADGHAEYHKWECQSTIEFAECESSCTAYSSYRNACGNNVDAKWMHNAVWGVTAQ